MKGNLFTPAEILFCLQNLSQANTEHKEQWKNQQKPFCPVKLDCLWDSKREVSTEEVAQNSSFVSK